MSMWTAIVLIVMAAMAGEAWRHHLKARSSREQRGTRRLKQRIDELKTNCATGWKPWNASSPTAQGDLKRQFDHLDKKGMAVPELARAGPVPTLSEQRASGPARPSSTECWKRGS